MDVVFAVMPFADVERPAIGVSLLQAALRKRGVSSGVEYFNLRMAETCGLPLFRFVSNSVASHALVGEWIFAEYLFGTDIPAGSDYVREFLTGTLEDEATLNALYELRRGVGRFVEACVERIRSLGPKVVGFTTTFHQTCASLAVARRLKEGPGSPVIVFGGANCEGEMGLQLIRSFPWIDYVSTGEADLTFPPAAERMLRGDLPKAVPGLIQRGEGLSVPEKVMDMNALPVPDYDGYFQQVRESSLAGELRPVALIETARGCWWGAKQHCTFCGLNGQTMAYRSKTVDRAFEEFKELATRYGVRKIDSVDNILDPRYVHELFPRLAASGLDLDLFYEVKANLRHEQLVLMRAGGVTMIQPGIESFSNQALKLMNKGSTGLQNIQLLKWCAELRIRVGWNLLAGFPGESPSEYDWQARILPLLTHLDPPSSCIPVRLDRFSPHFEKAEAFGLMRIRPMRAYFYVFPLGRTELMRLAYFFDFDYGDARRPDGYLGGLRVEVQKWLGAHRREDGEIPRLEVRGDDSELFVTDTRPGARSGNSSWSGLQARLLWACDSVQALTSLCARVGEDVVPVRTALQYLIDYGLVIEQDSRYLALPVRMNREAAHSADREKHDPHPGIQTAVA